ncbi:hypothetical protein CSKR_108596 [Clonorchis sinensis]|uniref:Uncharacterized protein n=1 Tax=Clonorchis sinensis TaxID=79923 RepID=A0A419QI22_CLOSI|nr:hypothetical protein CSKR_108596 [Clonorchis sinensis]
MCLVWTDGSSSWSANLQTGRSVARTRPLPLDFPCLGLGNLTVSQPSCFLQVAWQLDTGRVLLLDNVSYMSSNHLLTDLICQTQKTQTCKLTSPMNVNLSCLGHSVMHERDNYLTRSPNKLWFLFHNSYSGSDESDRDHNIPLRRHIMQRRTPNAHASRIQALEFGAPCTRVARVCLLVVDQMAVDLFARLGNWLANVSSQSRRHRHCALTMSPRLETKRLPANCQAWRTDQLPDSCCRRSLCGSLRWNLCLNRIQMDSNGFVKYTYLQTSLDLTGGSVESLVYDIPQVNMLNKGGLMFHVPYRIKINNRLMHYACIDDVTSIGDESLAIQLPSSPNRPTTDQRTRAIYILGAHLAAPCSSCYDIRDIAIHVYSQCTTHKVVEDSSTAHDRLRPFWGLAYTCFVVWEMG